MNIHTECTLEKMSVSSKLMWTQEAVYVFHYYKKKNKKKQTDKLNRDSLQGSLNMVASYIFGWKKYDYFEQQTVERLRTPKQNLIRLYY